MRSLPSGWWPKSATSVLWRTHQLMGYLVWYLRGLQWRSCAQRRNHQGRNAHARRLLTEAAWNYRFTPAWATAPNTGKRTERVDSRARVEGTTAADRSLCESCVARNVQINKICVAVARNWRASLGHCPHRSSATDKMSLQGEIDPMMRSAATTGRILGTVRTASIDSIRDLERGSFRDESMNGGNQPTDMSVIHVAATRWRRIFRSISTTRRTRLTHAAI